MGTSCCQVLVLVTLLLILDNSGVCFCRNSSSVCREQEREALLQIRRSFEDPYGLLSSWEGQDCCKWEGVACDGVYGHVLKLQLPQSTGYEDVLSLAGELNSSLLHLRYLNHLDLSAMDASNTRIPEFFGSMERLRYLNLSTANFAGNVPRQLGNLTNLEVLDLNYARILVLERDESGVLVVEHDESGVLVVDDNQWVSYLRSLKYLDMSGSDIANAGGLMQAISTLPSLSHLSLSDCRFQNFDMSSIHLANFTSLVHLRFLDLSYNLLEGPIPSTPFENMTSLQHLDLSWNNFNASIPMWFDKFISLVHLNLEENLFDSIEGGLFSFLKKKQYLEILCLSYNQIGQEISTTQGNSSELIENSLESLEMSGNHLRGALPNWLVHFTNLKYIGLYVNFFSGPIPSVIGSLPNLVTLDLSINQLNGTIPSSLGRLSSLRELYLSSNQLAGHIPESLGKLRALQYLILHDNHLTGNIPSSFFSGPIPSVIGSLSNLVTLDLSGNQLNGTIPSSLGRLSSLRELLLSKNQLAGHIPESMGKLRGLQDLDLSGNHLNGTIPSSFGNLSHLSVLDLSNNSLGGVISEIQFSNSSSLKYVDISDNKNLTFNAKPSWIPPFRLDSIRMSSCRFGTTFPRWIQTQVEADEIILANASLSGPLPNWLANLKFSVLDLSYNRISGPFPNIIIECSYLDLSHNLIFGSILTQIGNTQTLYLNDNLINDTIPSSICDMGSLDDLNLANNNLSGSIPDCWKGSLSHLTLSFNNLSGVIPSSIGLSSSLASLHLNGNHLYGELPLALRNCSRLVILDLGENKFSGSIPTWLGRSLPSLEILRLRGNRFVGSIPPQLCSLISLRILDMAANNLMGMIPRCLGNMSSMIHANQVGSAANASRRYMSSLIGANHVFGCGRRSSGSLYTPCTPPRGQNLDWEEEHVVEIMRGRSNEYTKVVLRLVVNLDLSSNFLDGSIPEELSFLAGLHGLNLSHNHLSGHIPNGIGNMRSLESLDLSNNYLSGQIPQGISTLTSLAHLNLSQNNLTGQIPKGNQIQTLDDPSIYAGNPLLCGDLLRKACPGSEAPQAPKIPPPKDTHEDGKLEKALFYGVVMIGFAIGFWGFFGVLQFKKDWRHAYFRFADQVADKAYVAIVVKVAKLKRLRLSRSV